MVRVRDSLTTKETARTAIGIVLGIIEVFIMFGMLYWGIIGLTKETAKKVFGGQNERR